MCTRLTYARAHCLRAFAHKRNRVIRLIEWLSGSNGNTHTHSTAVACRHKIVVYNCVDKLHPGSETIADSCVAENIDMHSNVLQTII